MSATAVPDMIPRRAMAGIFGGLFCGYAGLTAVIPVLPGYVKATYGAGDFAVGLVVTVTALTALLIRPVAGVLADRHGHQRVMRVGALVVALGGMLYFPPLGLAGLVVVRLMLGTGEAALFTAGAVWVVSLAPHSRRGQLIGLYGVSMWGGISAGTFLGAALQHFGYAVVWGFSAGAPLAGFLLIGIVRPATRDGEQHFRGQDTGGQGSRAALLLRPALLPGTALALAAAGYAGLAAFVVLYLRARGVHAGVAVLGTFSAVYAGTRLVIGRLPDQLGPRRVAAWCAIGEAAGLLIIAVAPGLLVALLGTLVMAVGFSLLHPSLALMVMNRTERSKQGAAIGAYTSFWDLGLAVWGPVTGAVASGFGYRAVFLVGAACAAAAAALAVCLRQPVPQPVTAS
jgi:MFS family permease